MLLSFLTLKVEQAAGHSSTSGPPACSSCQAVPSCLKPTPTSSPPRSPHGPPHLVPGSGTWTILAISEQSCPGLCAQGCISSRLWAHLAAQQECHTPKCKNKTTKDQKKSIVGKKLPLTLSPQNPSSTSIQEMASSKITKGKPEEIKSSHHSLTLQLAWQGLQGSKKAPHRQNLHQEWTPAK